MSVESLDQGRNVDGDAPESLFEKPQKDSSEELPDVEAAPRQDGVDFVAFFAFEVVAVHPVVMLGVADDRLDAATPSVPFPFAGRHALLFLVGQVDCGFVEHCRRSLVSLVAVSVLGPPPGNDFCLIKRFLEGVTVVRIAVDGLNTDDPAIPGGADQGNLATELVLLVGLSLGNALDFGCLHAVELVAVVAFLAEDLLCPLQHNGQKTFRLRAFALDVTDYPAKVETKLLLLPFGPLRLPGVTVTPLHDEGPLAQPLVGLTKIDARSLCQPYQDAAGLVIKPGIGRKGNSLFLNRGIDVDPLQVLLGHVLFALGRFDGPLEKLLHPFRANALAPLDQGSRVERELVLEVLKPAEVLPVTVLDELRHYRLVADVEGMLEVVEADQEPNRQAGATEVLDIQRAKFSVKDRPIDGIRQAVQGMPPVQDLVQPSAEQIALVNGA